MKKLMLAAIVVVILTSSVIYLALSKSVNVDSQQFKLKTILLQVLANAWDEKTLLDLGKKYSQPESGDPDYIKSFYFLHKASIEGNSEAQYLLSQLYKKGNGVPKDNALYLQHIQKASDKGFAKASYDLAHIKLDSEIPDEKDAGTILLKKSADQGDVAAINEILNAYVEGSWGDKNYIEAFKYAEKLASTGSSFGKYHLGALRYYGYGTAKDEEAGWRDMKAAADSGQVDAQVLVGSIFYKKTDYNSAEKYFKQSCEKKSPQGCSWASTLFNTSDFAGNNNKISIDYAFKAAELGDRSGYLFLAEAYWNGEGVVLDKAESLKWYKKAADAGSRNAQYSLAMGYLTGDVDGKQDYNNAVKYLRMAADKGHLDASGIIGTWFCTGLGVNKDFTEAHKYLKFALDGGSTNPLFQGWFGYLYLEGLGVKKDVAVGVTWTKKAADQGDGAAENYMGNIYAEGNGVQKDETKALNYFYSSLLHNHNNSATHIANYYYRKRLFVSAYAWYIVADHFGSTATNSSREVLHYMTLDQQNAAIEDANKWIKKIEAERAKQVKS